MDAEKSLNRLRSKVAKVDDAILKLLIKRFKITDEVGRLKKKHGLSVVYPAIEKKMIARLIKNSHGHLDKEVVVNLYTQVFTHSKHRQSKI